MGQTYKEAFPLYSTEGPKIPEALWPERVLDPASWTFWTGRGSLRTMVWGIQTWRGNTGEAAETQISGWAADQHCGTCISDTGAFFKTDAGLSPCTDIWELGAVSGKRKPGGSGHADCAEILCRDGQEDPLSGSERESWHCRKYKRGFCHGRGWFYRTSGSWWSAGT